MNKGEITSIYYKDLTPEEKELVDNIERESARKRKAAFIADPRYKDINVENVWWLKDEYINNWRHEDNYLFTKCECGSLQFETLRDTLASDALSRNCLMKCSKCGRIHIEYN